MTLFYTFLFPEPWKCFTDGETELLQRKNIRTLASIYEAQHHTRSVTDTSSKQLPFLLLLLYTSLPFLHPRYLHIVETSEHDTVQQLLAASLLEYQDLKWVILRQVGHTLEQHRQCFRMPTPTRLPLPNSAKMSSSGGCWREAVTLLTLSSGGVGLAGERSSNGWEQAPLYVSTSFSSLLIPLSFPWGFPWGFPLSPCPCLHHTNFPEANSPSFSSPSLFFSTCGTIHDHRV